MRVKTDSREFIVNSANAANGMPDRIGILDVNTTNSDGANHRICSNLTLETAVAIRDKLTEIIDNAPAPIPGGFVEGDRVIVRGRLIGVVDRSVPCGEIYVPVRIVEQTVDCWEDDCGYIPSVLTKLVSR